MSLFKVGGVSGVERARVQIKINERSMRDQPDIAGRDKGTARE